MWCKVWSGYGGYEGKLCVAYPFALLDDLVCGLPLGDLADHLLAVSMHRDVAYTDFERTSKL